MSANFKSISIKGSNKLFNSDFIQITTLLEGWVGIICDGVGDKNEAENWGKKCAEKMIELIEKSIETDPLKKVKSAIENTNKYLYSVHRNDLNNFKGATTLVVLYLLNHTACWGHVGDSRIYKLKNGRLNLLTKDHSVIQQLVDGGFLTLKEAALHSGTNVIGRAMGEKPDIIADVSKMNLQPFNKNRFFLCTDGVTNLLSDAQIESCLQNDEIDECTENLISLIKKFDITDDTSFILVDAL